MNTVRTIMVDGEPRSLEWFSPLPYPVRACQTRTKEASKKRGGYYAVMTETGDLYVVTARDITLAPRAEPRCIEPARRAHKVRAVLSLVAACWSLIGAAWWWFL